MTSEDGKRVGRESKFFKASEFNLRKSSDPKTAFVFSARSCIGPKRSDELARGQKCKKMVQ